MAEPVLSTLKYGLLSTDDSLHLTKMMQNSFVPVCCLNIHDEVNDLSPWAQEMQVLNLQEPCRICYVSILVARLTKGSAFLSHAHLLRLPRVTTAQQKCHSLSSSEKGSPCCLTLLLCTPHGIFFSFSLFQFSENTHLHSVKHWWKKFTHTAWQNSNPPSSDGRPWVLALASAGKICLSWNMNLQYCDTQALTAGQNVSYLSQLCKHAFQGNF